MSKKITINGKEYKRKPEKSDNSCSGCAFTLNPGCIAFPDCTGHIFKEVKRKGGK